MNIKFNGYKENVLTFECVGTVKAGDLVAMSASGKVAASAESAAFIGVCLSVRDGYAAVQLSGYVEKAKSGAVNVGFNKLVAAADNAVKTGSSGKECLVIYSDEDTVGFIL